MAALTLDRVTRTYPGGHAALHELDLQVADGEFLVLVGPSGCGKSTLLRLVAGLDAPTAGRIRIGGADLTDVPPQERNVAMVFQSYALYPHMTVRENLGYGLKVRGQARDRIAARTSEVANALDIEGLLDRRPAQLSGGQRQRVALGRAMVRKPQAFLLDEPLSNLDPSLRTQARAELLRLYRQLGTTTLYVTHDQEEAMTLGSRVAVMRDGAVEQVAPPMELYNHPANTFVARFIGSPPMNLLEPSVLGVDAPPTTLFGVRPHDVVLSDDGPIRATVEIVEPRGHDTVVHARVDGSRDPAVLVVIPNNAMIQTGTEIRLAARQDRLHPFDRDTGERLPT